MNVDIHSAGCNLQPENTGRIPPGEKGVFIGLLQSGLQQSRTDEAAVAEKELGTAVSAPGGRGRNKTIQGESAFLT